MLKCAAYNSARAKMYEKVRQETGYDMECMSEEWRMEAMLGEGVLAEEDRKIMRKHVMRYVLSANFTRRKWLEI